MGVFASIKSLFKKEGSNPPSLKNFNTKSPVVNSDYADELVFAAEELSTAFPDKSAPMRKGTNPTYLHGELWGTVFGIEYEDAEKNITFRRISMRHFVCRRGKHALLSAHCFERDAIRSFRVDRIQSVIDEYGEVFEPEAFFEDELGVSLEDMREEFTYSDESEYNPRLMKVLPVRPMLPGVAQRATCRDGIRVLVAVGRSDRDFSDLEIAVILAFIENEAALSGVTCADKDTVALRAYLKRMRPDEKVFSECLERLSRSDFDKKGRFLRALRSVINADGQVHQAEVELITRIERQLGS